MNCFFKISIVILYVFIVNLSYYSQSERDIEDILTNIIEFIEENESEDIDNEYLTEKLHEYYNNKLDINNLENIIQLKEIGLINEIQYNSISYHYNKNGKLLNLLELQSINYLDIRTIKNILPFITLNSNYAIIPININNLINQSKNDFYFRIFYFNKQKDEDYIGDNSKILLKYNYKYYDKIKVGLKVEKDKGEGFISSKSNMPDFVSGFIELQKMNIFDQIILGDFEIKYAQGLSIWNGRSIEKSSNIYTVKKFGPTIKSYNSVDENNFFRGIALKKNIKNISINTFYSLNKIDANINENNIVNSFYNSGYHRDSNELLKKNNLKENTYGLIVDYRYNSLKLGANYIRYNYNKNFEIDNGLNKITNNNNNEIIGVNYDYSYFNFNFFGESNLFNSNFSSLNGISAYLNKNFSIILLHRYLDMNNINKFSNPISFSSNNNNENSLYTGINFYKNIFNFNSWFDISKNYWLKNNLYSINNQSVSSLSQLDINFNKNLIIYLRYSFKSYSQNDIESSVNTYKIAVINENNYRFQLTYQFSKNIKISTRIEHKTYNKNNTTSYGIMTYQNISYDFKNSPISINLRYTLFDIDNYNSRIYAYENDVLHYYYIPSFYGKGASFYSILRYTFKKKIDIWIKYSKTFDKTTNNENNKSELKLLLRFLL